MPRTESHVVGPSLQAARPVHYVWGNLQGWLQIVWAIATVFLALMGLTRGVFHFKVYIVPSCWVQTAWPIRKLGMKSSLSSELPVTRAQSPRRQGRPHLTTKALLRERMISAQTNCEAVYNWTDALLVGA
jgi:hypothetical protein